MRQSKNVCLSLTILRHGETDQNSQSPRILQGQLDTEINEQGNKQCISLAWMLQKEKFDYIYTSDLKRAIQTTKHISKFHKDVPVISDKRFREQGLGDLTGLQWPTAKKILKRENMSYEEHLKSGGGEDKQKFKERVIEMYSQLVRNHLVDTHNELVRVASQENMNAPKVPKMKRKHILIVTHGGWITAFLKFIQEELRFNLECEPSKAFPRCTGVYQINISKDTTDNDYEWQGRIVVMNSVSHLAGLEKKVASASLVKTIDESQRNSANSSKDFITRSNSSMQNLIGAVTAKMGAMGTSKVSSNDEEERKKKNLGW